MSSKITIDPFYLQHHGILGQKWGVRRYQNTDGTLTEAGKKRYRAENVYDIEDRKGLKRRLNDLDKAIAKNARDNTDAVRKLVTKRNYSTKALKKKVISEENITRGRSEIDALLAKNSGKYNITTRSTWRNVTNGKDVLKSLGYTALLNTLAIPISRVAGGAAGLHGGATAIGVVGTGKLARGTHYNVKEKAPKVPTETVHVVKVSDDQINRWAKEIEAEDKKYDLGINSSKTNRKQKIL